MKIISLRQMTLVMLPAMLPLPLLAADNDATLVVTAAPSEQGLYELDTPAALSVVSGDDMRQAAPRVNLSENLSSVPGLQIQNRQNYAQDLQISMRGLGSRSTYGVRGLRIYVDGIPATMPEGSHRPQILISARLTMLKCCAAPSRHSMAMRQAGSSTSQHSRGSSRRRWKLAAGTAVMAAGATVLKPAARPVMARMPAM